MSRAADELRKTLGIDSYQAPDIDTPLNTEDDEAEPKGPPARLDIITAPTVLDPALLKESDLANDYIFARNLNHTLLKLVGDQLAGAARVAEDTEHPRAYGVFNELAGTMRTLVQDLLGLQKVFKEVKRDDKVMDPPPTVNVTVNGGSTGVYSGSTTSVLRIIEENRPMPTTLDIGDAAEEVTVKVIETDGTS